MLRKGAQEFWTPTYLLKDEAEYYIKNYHIIITKDCSDFNI